MIYGNIEIFVVIQIAEVLHQSKPLPGSPFTCESYDPKKVTIRGIPRGPLVVHNSICFMRKYSKYPKVSVDLKKILIDLLFHSECGRCWKS